MKKPTPVSSRIPLSRMMAACAKIQEELDAKKAEKELHFKEKGMAPNRINITLFNSPQLQQVIGAHEDIAERLAEISAIIDERSASASTPEQAAEEDEMEIENIEAMIEESDSQLAIEFVEMEKAHALATPEVPFDIAKASKSLSSDRSKAKARATKVKDNAKPGSRMVGGSSELANSSHTTGRKA